jgi:hypothetical protein
VEVGGKGVLVGIGETVGVVRISVAGVALQAGSMMMKGITNVIWIIKW